MALGADPKTMAWCALLQLCLPLVPGVELQGRWLMSGNHGEHGSPQRPGLSSFTWTKLAHFLPEDKKKKGKANTLAFVWGDKGCSPLRWNLFCAQ